VIMSCEESLSICVIALASSFGAIVAAMVAVVKANAAHMRLNMQEKKKE